jgi:hypothetical protein
LLTQADLHLLDVTDETAKVFDESSIPFRRLSNSDSITSLTAGTLIVGEGINLDEQRGLTDALIDAAGRGVLVLLLAPAKKLAEVVGADVLNSERVRRVAFRRGDVLLDFDKRFDTDDWSDGETARSSVSLQSRHNNASIGIAETANGWPWLELHVAAPESAGAHGKLIVCGFGMIRHWRATPVPRYLLAELLQQSVESNGDALRKENQ